MFWRIVWLALIGLVLWWVWSLGSVVRVIVAVIVIAGILYWAYNNSFTVVEEGTSKIVMRGGEFRKALIAWKGYTFKITKEGKQAKEEDNWEVVEGKEHWHPFGGLRRFGIPLLDKIHGYRHRWVHLHEDGEIVKHDEWLDFALLKKDLYVIEIPLIEEKGAEEKGAEDKDGVPLGISVVLPMRIVNPYIALFVVRRWLPMITGMVRARLRNFVARYHYKEELLPMRAKENGKEVDLLDKFWEELKEDFKAEGGKKLGENIRIFGVEIERKKTGILSIDPSKIYREETTKKYRAEREREKTVIDADAKMRAASRMAKQKALEAGRMHGEIKKILMEKYGYSERKADKYAREYVEYWKGSEEGVIEDWRFKGAEGGIFAEIAKIVAVAETAKKKVTERSKKKVAKKPPKN